MPLSTPDCQVAPHWSHSVLSRWTRLSPSAFALLLDKAPFALSELARWSSTTNEQCRLPSFCLAPQSLFLRHSAETIPLPRGAGINRTRTAPHLPVTWSIDWGIVDEPCRAWCADSVAPIAASHGHDRELGGDDGKPEVCVCVLALPISSSVTSSLVMPLTTPSWMRAPPES